MKKRILEYTAIFQEEKEGGFSVWVPDLPGCASQGETFEDALKNIKEAIELYLEDSNETSKDTDEFKKQFTEACMTRFGSGWGWLVKAADGKLEICSTSNAENPLTEGKKPIFTCDVWEHAYYIDTRNSRPQYMENFWKVVNWKFVMDHFAK